MEDKGRFPGILLATCCLHRPFQRPTQHILSIPEPVFVFLAHRIGYRRHVSAACRAAFAKLCEGGGVLGREMGRRQ